MSRSLVVMREHGTLFGLWADVVKEVRSDINVTPLPRELPYFEGISNYKGSMIPVFCLACISDREEPEAEEDKLIIIVEGERGIFGLAVSEVLDVTDNTTETMPSGAMKLDQGALHISEIIRLEEPVFVLDVEGILGEICE